MAWHWDWSGSALDRTGLVQQQVICRQTSGIGRVSGTRVDKIITILSYYIISIRHLSPFDSMYRTPDSNHSKVISDYSIRSEASNYRLVMRSPRWNDGDEMERPNRQRWASYFNDYKQHTYYVVVTMKPRMAGVQAGRQENM